jgi:diguanylate cyclase (GGDEF)-like protein
MGWPAFRFRSLQARIVVVFLALLLTVQIAGYGFIDSAITTNARRHAQDELAVSERVFNRLIAQSNLRLLQAAQALAGDFALREALATRDHAAMATILRRHPERASGDLAMLVGTDARVLADAGAPRGRPAPAPVAALVARAAQGSRAPAIGLIGDAAYQLVAVPTGPAKPTAWVVIGLRLDDRVVKDLAALTSLDVSLAAWDGESSWRVLASTRSPDASSALLAALAADPSEGQATARFDGNPVFENRVFGLAAEGGTIVTAVLQRSLDQATGRFKDLQATLLALTLVGLIATAIGSIVIVRRITRPLRALVNAARKMEEGDYQHRVTVAEDADEVGELAAAFNLMCDGIAAREQRISELAYADPLTGLPNRALFNDRIGQAVRAAERSEGQLAVLTMDLDRFKHVNDTLGHHMGDLLLREVAYRLHRALQRGTDTVARLGGDEFAVLLPTDGIDGAKLMARKIVEVLSAPLTIEGHLVDVGASIGIAAYPQHGEDADTLMRRADVAMYSAKRAGTGFELYDSRHDQNTPQRLSLLGELRQAVEQDQLGLLFQPRLELGETMGHSAEALLRWQHPERGVVLPERFVPFCEQTGYIKSVTRWVLNAVFRQCAAWRARGIELRVSVNISARDLHTPDFPRSLAEIAAAYGMTPQAIALEVTESAVMEDPAHALEILERLHAMGVRLAIDDFGTGYSSLAYLKRLPVDELKIDKSFVMGLVRDRDDAAIVRATIDLAHHMRLVVTAEGVEDANVLETLRRLGCDLAQGNYISPPVPAAALERWIRQGPAARADAPGVVLH